jgi:hypothetical protein
VIIDLKTQLQEDKIIEEFILNQLNEKQQDCEKLEVEIILLNGNLRKKRSNQNLKIVQKYGMIFLIVKDHKTIIQD